MPTILVTGATGSIGRVVVPALLGAGYDVRGQFLRSPGSHPEVDWRRWNFADSLDLGPLLKGCDGIIHLAAEIANPAAMVRMNVDLTNALAVAAMQESVRYLAYASSIVVYGSPRKSDVDEYTPLIDPAMDVAQQYYAEPYMQEYARTKVLSEMMLHALEPAIKIDILRPAVVVHSEQLLQARGWSAARNLLNAHRSTQYVFVTDVAAAVVHLLGRGLASGVSGIDAYNVCDEDCGTFEDLLATAGRSDSPRQEARMMEFRSALDLLKDMVKHRQLKIRYPLGLIKFSGARLRSTGFNLPTGIRKAVAQSLAKRNID